MVNLFGVQHGYLKILLLVSSYLIISIIWRTQKTITINTNCITTCCHGESHDPREKKKKIKTTNICRSAYGFLNGAVYFRFSTKQPCNFFNGNDSYSDLCALNPMSHFTRSQLCSTKGKCDTPVTTCLMRFCEIGYKRAFAASQKQMIPEYQPALSWKTSMLYL